MACQAIYKDIHTSYWKDVAFFRAILRYKQSAAIPSRSTHGFLILPDEKNQITHVSDIVQVLPPDPLSNPVKVVREGTSHQRGKKKRSNPTT